MLNESGVARRSVETLSNMSSLPPSFDGSPFLYAAALTSVMSIACLGIAVAGWMLRDTWRDRLIVHPHSLLFSFRAMMALVGFASFLRAMPEVLYLQIYGDPDVSAGMQAAVLTAKRVADSLAIWFVLAWQIILVVIYPHLCLVLKSAPARYVYVDTIGRWPRIRRPLLCFIVILAVALTFAYGKVYAH